MDQALPMQHNLWRAFQWRCARAYPFSTTSSMEETNICTQTNHSLRHISLYLLCWSAYILFCLCEIILFRLLFVIFVCIHLRDPSQNPDEWYFFKKPSCICCRTLGTPADTLPMRNHTSIISAIACWCGSYWVQCSRAVILSSLHGHRCALYIYIFEYNVN